MRSLKGFSAFFGLSCIERLSGHQWRHRLGAGLFAMAVFLLVNLHRERNGRHYFSKLCFCRLLDITASYSSYKER